MVWVKEEKAGKWSEGGGREGGRGIVWNMKYLHMPDMRVSTIF